ncbi:MAG: diaminopimelate epimerase [Epsilonproteobacteria bacterium]|nr:MAG: diaminopimelate epimerase [Campylobacterota bacterium]
MRNIRVFDATGNNFVITQNDKVADYTNEAKLLCKKYKTDGLIVVTKPTFEQISKYKIDFVWQFYNNNGTTASMCGNGTRAVAMYYFKYIKPKLKISFLTDAGVIKTIIDKNMVQTTMTKHTELKKPFQYKTKTWWMVDTGVPHLVTIVDDIKVFDIKLAINMREKFDANVNFVEILSSNKLSVRTFERGVEGETLSCGTGMVASFLYALKQNLVSNEIKVLPKSGLHIFVYKKDKKIYLKGEVSEQQIS